MNIFLLVIGVLAFVGSVSIFIDVVKNRKVDKFILVLYSLIVMTTFLGWVIEDLRKVIA